MKKYKMTGCARFFIFLLIFLPAIYFGASYYKGEDGLQNIKDFLGIGQNDSPRKSDGDTKDYSAATKELNEKDELITNLRKKVESLEEQLKQKEMEIEHLKQRSGN